MPIAAAEPHGSSRRPAGAQSRAAGTPPTPYPLPPTRVGFAWLADRPEHSRTPGSSKLSGIGLSAEPCSLHLGPLPTAVPETMQASEEARMGIVESPLLRLPLIFRSHRASIISCLAVELGEIEALELFPVAVHDADATNVLARGVAGLVSRPPTCSNPGNCCLLTWKISTSITLSGAVRLTLWRSSLTRPAIVLITTSRFRLLWLRMVGRIANCDKSVFVVAVVVVVETPTKQQKRGRGLTCRERFPPRLCSGCLTLLRPRFTRCFLR